MAAVRFDFGTSDDPCITIAGFQSETIAAARVFGFSFPSWARDTQGMIDDSWRNFPQFIQAIRRSITHGEGLCRHILEEKANLSLFGVPGMYLRINFGEPQVSSDKNPFEVEM